MDVPNVLQHVMARGIERSDIFRDRRDREEFLKRLAVVVEWGKPDLLAWSLMSNHFHLLLRPKEVPLASLMRRLMTGYSVWHNRRHSRSGHLFQNRYKSIVVEEEPYFLELVRYIHLNPLRAGVVHTMDELEQFAWSGHAVLLGRREYKSQDVDDVLSQFAGTRAAARRRYREFVAAGVEDGRREDLRGGGLVRSAGGWEELAGRGKDERELGDERVLGRGEFVERILEDAEGVRPARPAAVEGILREVSAAWEVSPEMILGRSRERRITSARREFLRRAHDEGGMPMATLGRQLGIAHTSVRGAILRARESKEKG